MQTLLIVALILLGAPAGIALLWYVHCALDRVCIRHAVKFCQRRHFEIDRIRWKPAFNHSGVKTESTLVQLDCRDAEQQRRLVELLVWPFGVRKLLSNEPFPECDEQSWREGDV